MTTAPRPVLLYGPPASGKDTVTAALIALGRGWLLFPMLKAGAGRTRGYRMTTGEYLAHLTRWSGEVLWSTRKYDATYVLDRSALTAFLVAEPCAPVVHLGHPDGIDTITATALDWIVVALECPRDITEQRLRQRHAEATDLEAVVVERLRAFDATPSLEQADLRFDTSTVSPEQVAARVAAYEGQNSRQGEGAAPKL